MLQILRAEIVGKGRKRLCDDKEIMVEERSDKRMESGAAEVIHGFRQELKWHQNTDISTNKGGIEKYNSQDFINKYYHITFKNHHLLGIRSFG